MPRDNLVAAVFRLNAAETPVGMAGRMRAMPRGLGDDVARALIDWMRRTGAAPIRNDWRESSTHRY